MSCSAGVDQRALPCSGVDVISGREVLVSRSLTLACVGAGSARMSSMQDFTRCPSATSGFSSPSWLAPRVVSCPVNG